VTRTAKLVAAAAALMLLAFTCGFVLFARSVASYAPGYNQRGDAIVVLTGGDLRVAEGAKLLREGRGARLLISGVNRQTGPEDLKRVSGLPDRLFSCCVDIDYEANTTSDNADETKAWAEARGLKRLIVVTSSYHMPRSLTELRRALPDVRLVPHPVFSHKVQTSRWWTDPYTTRVLLSEYVKFLPSALRYGAAVLVRGNGSALAGAKSHASAQ
jgi:uncharacterized SAM-binding protein YcdF (DUF218 family)